MDKTTNGVAAYYSRFGSWAGYSTLYEAGLFRYLLYKGTKPLAHRAK